MYNTFKDVMRDFRTMRIITMVSLVVCGTVCVLCYLWAMSYVKEKEKLIYVLDNGNAFRLAKIHNVIDNRTFEVRDFSRQLMTLASNFSSDVSSNEENLKIANSYFSDQSFRRYMETLQNSQFFQDMAARNLTQSLVNVPGQPMFNINITGGQTPYKVAVQFFIKIGNTYKKMTAGFMLEDVMRTDLNSHGFLVKNFVIEAEELQQLPS